MLKLEWQSSKATRVPGTFIVNKQEMEPVVGNLLRKDQTLLTVKKFGHAPSAWFLGKTFYHISEQKSQ